MAKKKFKMTLKIKDCAKEFKEGMGKGVLVTQELVYDVTDDVVESSMFRVELHDREVEFIEKNVEVIMEQMEDEDE